MLLQVAALASDPATKDAAYDRMTDRNRRFAALHESGSVQVFSRRQR
jgi:hypothetical protein